MKKIGLYLFIKFFGFSNKKHVIDFLRWNDNYIWLEAIKRKRGNATIINNDHAECSICGEQCLYGSRHPECFNDLHKNNKNYLINRIEFLLRINDDNQKALFEVEDEKERLKKLVIDIYVYCQNVEYDVVDIDEIDKIFKENKIKELINVEEYNYNSAL